MVPNPIGTMGTRHHLKVSSTLSGAVLPAALSLTVSPGHASIFLLARKPDFRRMISVLVLWSDAPVNASSPVVWEAIAQRHMALYRSPSSAISGFTSEQSKTAKSLYLRPFGAM